MSLFDVHVDVHAVVHVHHDDAKTAERLTAIDGKLDTLVSQGAKLMAANAQILQFLSELKVYTDEIAADIDKLIAENDLSPEVTAALKAHSDTLKAIAAKNDEPLPPPVEPTI